MKKLGVILLFGILVICMRMKFNSVEMNSGSSSSSSSDMDSRSTDDKEYTQWLNQLEQLEQQIGKKEQELENAGRFEEFAVAKELNVLREKQREIYQKVILRASTIPKAIPAVCSSLRKKFIEFVYLKTAKTLQHGSTVSSVASGERFILRLALLTAVRAATKVTLA